MLANSEKLLILRTQLYGAMQQLKGEDAAEFWKLIDEIQACKLMYVKEGSVSEP